MAKFVYKNQPFWPLFFYIFIQVMISLILFTLLTQVFARDGFITVPIRRVYGNATIKEETNGQRIIEEPLTNKVWKYLAKFKLGGQDQLALIDTGSSDLWVYQKTSKDEIAYDPGTGHKLPDPFETCYIDGTHIKGDFYVDDMTWGDVDMKIQFGVSTSRGIDEQGVFGINGRARNTKMSNGQPYETFPFRLKSTGHTDSVSYSLYLNGVDEENGFIVFGAIDTSRFIGKLKIFDVDIDRGFQLPFFVAGQEQRADLDCGSSVTYLDDFLVDSIANDFGATWDPKIKAYKVPGPEIPKGDLTFSFFGVSITVPASELWYQRAYGKPDYHLSILPSSQTKGVNILGDNFLRSAYVVYDLDHGKVGIAPANFAPGPSNFVKITTEGIPSQYTK